MSIKRLLITGISGLLGSNLAWYFRECADVTGIYFSHPVAFAGVKTIGVDLRDYREVRRLFQDVNPDVVIHCASRTDVDILEGDKEGGWQSNVLTTQVVLDALRDLPAKMVYISTDAVYPGDKGPYTENSQLGPRNWYGMTKLDGERLVQARPGHLILRTNIFGWNVLEKESIGEWFLNRLQKQVVVNGFVDAKFSSIYTFSLARIIDQCLSKRLSGIYNCSCSDSLTKFEFGQQIARLFHLDSGLVLEATLDHAGLTADRGHDMSLDVKSLEDALGHSLPTMLECLQQFHTDWKSGLSKDIKKFKPTVTGKSFYPIRQEIPYGGQAIDDTDIEAVVTTLKSPFLTQGPGVQSFEENLAKTVGASHAVAVNSGTSALHLACLVLGVGRGDEVITSPNTFVASANCAIYCGARPVFADIDPDTFNISPTEIEKKINQHTKAIIPVHFAGQCCDMDAIYRIVKDAEIKYGHRIFIIEDGCHALGSFYKGSPVGACKYSDMTVFSFHPVKHITTGEGGAVVSNSVEHDRALRRFRSHGITSLPADFRDHNQAFGDRKGKSSTVINPWYYEQQDLGFNYRITDIQSALGLSQLRKLDVFKEARRRIVVYYRDAFQEVDGVVVPHELPDCDSNFHLFVLRIDFRTFEIDRAHFMGALLEKGVRTQVHYIPVHTQPYFKEMLGTGWGDCPLSEEYYHQCLSIPLYPNLTSDEMERVVTEIKKLLGL